MKQILKNVLYSTNRLFFKLGRVNDSLQHLWSEFVLAAVPDDQRKDFTIVCYASSDDYFVEADKTVLFDWEEKSIKEHFPKPPAKILVGGSGGGREMAVLARKGYNVLGFEPCREYVEYTKKVIDKTKLIDVVCADYEEFSKNTTAVNSYAPFDAVILGWGSFGHLLIRENRVKLFKQLKSVCPKGPVLVSWPSVPEIKTGIKTKTIRKMFSSIGLENASENDSFHTHVGFIHILTNEEVAEIAEESGYEIRFPDVTPAYNYGIMLPKK